MRKHRGDITYYLEREGGGYRLVKKIKTRTNVEVGKKTKKVAIYDCILSEQELEDLDFNIGGLRYDDEAPIKSLIQEIKQNAGK